MGPTTTPALKIGQCPECHEIHGFHFTFCSIGKAASSGAAKDAEVEAEIDEVLEKADEIGLLPSQTTIDSGRLVTLERQRKFHGLRLYVIREGATSATDDTHWFEIDAYDPKHPASAGILSDRRVARNLRAMGGMFRDDGVLADKTEEITSWVQASMRDWCNNGYPVLEGGIVASGRIRASYVRYHLIFDGEKS